MAKQPDNALVTREAAPLLRTALDPQALIQTALDKGSSVETLERLFDLAKNVQGERARQAWYSAMAEFQRTCPPIRKTSTAQVKTRTGGNFSYTYAPLVEITQKILPVMGPLGLSVSYRVQHETNRVIAVCRVSHELGHHEESGPVPMPIDTESGMGASAAQRVGIATSYAKRYALLAIIGLAPEEEDMDGKPAGPQVRMPQRESRQEAPTAAPVAAPAHNVWTGTIKQVKEKSGTTGNRAWKLWTIICSDGMEFGTFSESEADFARQTGPSEIVQIAWEETAKGGRKVLSIVPAEREPGDEVPDA